MRPVVKIEGGEGEGQGAEERQEEAGAGRAVQRGRRRVGEAGDAAWDEVQMLRLNMELQAQAIQGMEQSRVLREELLQAKARVAELAVEKAQLAAELKIKDVVVQSKDTLLQAQAREMQTKDLLLQAKDREISVLHADIERLNAGCAAGGAARQPVPAPPAQGEALFQEGQRLYGEQRFSEAAERWGRAALLQDGPSRAHLSNMLIDGRAGVAVNKKRAFELAAAGAALGCARSKGVLGRCFLMGYGVAKDEARGLALGRESEAAGSCFGQVVVGLCYNVGLGVAQDYAEAMRLYRLAAAQGHAGAQTNLGHMFDKGLGVAQDRAEAIRWYHLAAAQGYAYAQTCLTQLGFA
jgi:TPR repeat protein